MLGIPYTELLKMDDRVLATYQAAHSALQAQQSGTVDWQQLAARALEKARAKQGQVSRG